MSRLTPEEEERAKAFLTELEVRRATGLKRPKAQLRFLHGIGRYDAFPNALGQVIVPREPGKGKQQVKLGRVK